MNCRVRLTNHTMDVQVITEALVVVVIGGLGSVLGTFLAAIIVSELNAFGILVFPKISIVLVFLVMAGVATEVLICMLAASPFCSRMEDHILVTPLGLRVLQRSR